MRGLGLSRLATVLVAACCVGETIAGEVLKKTPQIQTLPPLREQSDLVDSWTKERKALIPGLLRKYGVDAWLVGYPFLLLTLSEFLVHIVVLPGVFTWKQFAVIHSHCNVSP
jgi:hypothetical protein